MIMRMMFGGRTTAFDMHYTGLNFEFLSAFLHQAGFVDILRVSRLGFFRDTSEMAFCGQQISLNLVARMPNKAVGYPAGNALAEAARTTGLNGMVYPSVRDPGGTCLAALRPHAVQSVAQGDVYKITWAGNPQPTVIKLG